MGRPMASHLSRAGHSAAAVRRRSRRRRGPRRARCRTPSPPHRRRRSPRPATSSSPWCPTARWCARSSVGDQGLLHGFAPGALLLDTSSSEPWLTEGTAEALAGRGVAMVDAPVSGAEWGAQAAELVFMVGGAAADLERVRPLLAAMGKAVFHVGGLGAGHAMKCLNNLITSVNLLALSEGLAMGKRYGLDPEAMVDVLNVSTGMSWVAQTHIKQRVISRRFDDPFKLALMVKDIGIAMELGARHRHAGAAERAGAGALAPRPPMRPSRTPASASWCAGSSARAAPRSRPAPGRGRWHERAERHEEEAALGDRHRGPRPGAAPRLPARHRRRRRGHGQAASSASSASTARTRPARCRSGRRPTRRGSASPRRARCRCRSPPSRSPTACR